MRPLGGPGRSPMGAPLSTVPPGEVPFLADLGLTLADDGDTLQLALQPRHLNRRGVAHGGLLMTLLDAALTPTTTRWPPWS